MLKYDNVSISHQNTLILQDISVDFPKGEIISLIGPNGCGKTTLLQCLIGSSKLEKGKILLDGTDFFMNSPKERAKKLAYLPQVRTIIPKIPVKILVEHGRFPYMGFGRKKSAKDIEIVKEAMEYTKVSEYANQRVDILSGGIRQRVFLAMILAQDTPYIILDEPTTYLDIKGQREFLGLIKGLQRKGKTIIMVLHDLNQAIEVSDRLIVMKERRIAAQGKTEECISEEVIEGAFGVKCKRFVDEDRSYYFFR